MKPVLAPMQRYNPNTVKKNRVVEISLVVVALLLAAFWMSV